MKNQKGQTSVEYILLVLVMIAMGTAFFKKMNEFIVDNPDSMMNRYLGGFRNVIGSPDGSTSGVSGQYKKFNLPR